MEVNDPVVKDPAMTKADPIKPKYDPNKKYRWPQNTNFTFSGGEFGVILNSLRQTLSTKEAQSILLAYRASEIIEKALVEGVESGVVYEDPS